MNQSFKVFSMQQNLISTEAESLTELNNSGVYSFQIQPQDVDFQSNVTLASLVNILLTTAGYNADENGFGIRNLNELNCSWVLLRLALEMDVFPRQYESIKVQTWIESIGRASTTRNFKIFDSKNKMIGQAISNWAMIDLNSRKAQDLFNLKGIKNFESGISLDINKPLKINAFEGDFIYSLKVKYSDIDINIHVNSMRYVQWISDCLSVDTYKKKSIKRFDINYMNEIVYDEQVSIFAKQNGENEYDFEIMNSDRASCRAKLILSPCCCEN